MSLRELYTISPTGIVGMFLLGGVFSAQFGMSAVYGAKIGMTLAEISMFVSSIFIGALVLQYPIGWLSDRMDRRRLIFILCVLGLVGGIIGVTFDTFEAILISGLLVGGVSNPMYSLLIAYTNDYLGPENMAAASGGLIFANGLGAIAGPLITGWAMTSLGPQGFWVYLSALMVLLAAYVLFRMTQRVSPFIDEDNYEVVPYAPLMASSSPIAVEVAQEFYIENASEIEKNHP